ncbi:MAG TPA: GNAT family N-acetyltransferase [Gemmatimonadales bacterium]|nr:GNAT family N-acetyltransferase [Gemmatimonadales bacterium]
MSAAAPVLDARFRRMPPRPPAQPATRAARPSLVRRALARLGPPRLVPRRLVGALVGAARLLYGRERFGIFVAPTAQPDGSAPPAGCTIVPAGAADWAQVTRLGPAPLQRRLAAARASGRRCLVARRGDTVVGCAWIGTADQVARELHPLRLPDDSVYLHLVFVVPAERGGGLGAALQRAAIAHAGALGYARVWGVVARTNRSALGVVARHRAQGMQGRRLGDVTMVCLGGRLYARFERAAEWSGPLPWEEHT